MYMATASEMVEALTTALASNVGVVEVQVDGQRVKYDRKQALEELQFWQSQCNRAEGKRPIAGQIRLDGSW